MPWFLVSSSSLFIFSSPSGWMFTCKNYLYLIISISNSLCLSILSSFPILFLVLRCVTNIFSPSNQLPTRNIWYFCLLSPLLYEFVCLLCLSLSYLHSHSLNRGIAKKKQKTETEIGKGNLENNKLQQTKRAAKWQINLKRTFNTFSDRKLRIRWDDGLKLNQPYNDTKINKKLMKVSICPSFVSSHRNCTIFIVDGFVWYFICTFILYV